MLPWVMIAAVPVATLALVCAACAAPATSTPEPHHAAVVTAPAHQVSLHVPTKLAIERTADVLAVKLDRTAMEAATITVGANHYTGVGYDLRVYPQGQASMSSGGGVVSGVDFQIGERRFNAREGLPVPGVTYIVEVDLVVFETDVAPQHMWSPEGPGYNVLLKRTLSQTVP